MFVWVLTRTIQMTAVSGKEYPCVPVRRQEHDLVPNAKHCLLQQ